MPDLSPFHFLPRFIIHMLQYPVYHTCTFIIESVQRYFTKRIEGLSLLPYSQRLRVLKLSSLEHRRIIDDQ